jgi:hypothetical protein
MTSVWLLDVLAVLMLVVATVSAIHLTTAWWPGHGLSVAGPGWSGPSPRGSVGADTDIAHLLMGVAMGGMLTSSVKTLPPHAWEAIFGLLTAWFAWHLLGDTKLNGLRSLLSGRRAAHLIYSAAMVYMLAPLTTRDGLDMTAICGGMAPSPKHPALALAFVLALICYSLGDLIGRLSGRRHSLEDARSTGVASADDTAPIVACRFTMGVTMALMLLVRS